MFVVPVLLVTFPAESMSLDSIPKICTLAFVVSQVRKIVNETWMILLL
jgi:hypothetical protein